MNYRINPFIKTYYKGETTALFNALTLDTVYLNKEECEKCFENPPRVLLDEGFFVPCDFNALQYFSKNTTHIRPSINVATFLLTSMCNFQCKYCFVETRIKQTLKSNMSKEIATKAVDILKRTVKDNFVSVVFYGGEPLLEFDILRHVVTYAKQVQLNAKYVLITNGSVMNDEIAVFLKNNHFEVGISLDGERQINDAMRINAYGEGTYYTVTAAIEKLLKHNVPIGISCTLSKHNINSPIGIMNCLKKYNLPYVSYNLPAPNDNITIDDSDRELFVKNLMAAETELLKAGILEDKIVDRRLRAFIEKRIYHRDCAAYGQQIVIMPNGMIGICHGLWPDKENSSNNTYFDIDVNYEGELSEHPIWKEWGSRTTYNMPQCWNCPAISLCGGGCSKNALLKQGSIWEVDTDICILMKEVVPWIIWTYYDLKK